MYIVQIKNQSKYSWKELPVTKCRFRDLSKAINLYVSIKASPMYADMDVRIWQTEAEHRVELNEPATA
jgi:hypothetical protein